MLSKYIVAFIANILIYSPSHETNIHCVHQVLQHLTQNKLFIIGENYAYHRSTISFLGCIISPDGVTMHPAKISTITEWPTPSTIKDLQRFLSFANFYQLIIQDFSSIALPLTALLKTVRKHLAWNPTAKAALSQLKTAFNTVPILKHPEPKKPFVVEVDASETGVGAILSK